MKEASNNLLIENWKLVAYIGCSLQFSPTLLPYETDIKNRSSHTDSIAVQD